MPTDPILHLNDIQGDVLEGLQKNSENFIFFKIADVAAFKLAMKTHVIPLITTAAVVHQREFINEQRKKLHQPILERWLGLNVSFTKDGMTELLGTSRPQLIVQKNGNSDNHFELGADDPAVISGLNDPPKTSWLPQFISDRIDGVFLLTGPDHDFVDRHSQLLLGHLGNSIVVVYSEIANVRPDSEKGHEHFGFLDGVSQPGVRGLTRRRNPTIKPDQGLPGQDLLWPGEFVFGYPGQSPTDDTAQGNPPTLPVSWSANSSFMVFRRLEQKVPEFNTFVAAQATTLGMTPELLASRMVGRWRSGAPMELAPLQDNPVLGNDNLENNDFQFGGDPFQRLCPYAAHIRKAYPRDDFPGGDEAPVQIHRIIRAGITFGPEVAKNENTTTTSRGLMFVCYQTSITDQFEFIQSQWVNNPGFIFGKSRPAGGEGGPVSPGFDTIIGQAAGGGPRDMDEPVPNYPTGDTRSALHVPAQFVVLTAAAYFYVPSMTALHSVLT
jgi:Dyp-type peroxidase family